MSLLRTCHEARVKTLAELPFHQIPWSLTAKSCYDHVTDCTYNLWMNHNTDIPYLHLEYDYDYDVWTLPDCPQMSSCKKLMMEVDWSWFHRGQSIGPGSLPDLSPLLACTDLAAIGIPLVPLEVPRKSRYSIFQPHLMYNNATHSTESWPYPIPAGRHRRLIKEEHWSGIVEQGDQWTSVSNAIVEEVSEVAHLLHTTFAQMALDKPGWRVPAVKIMRPEFLFWQAMDGSKIEPDTDEDFNANSW